MTSSLWGAVWEKRQPGHSLHQTLLEAASAERHCWLPPGGAGSSEPRNGGPFSLPVTGGGPYTFRADTDRIV